MPDYSKAVVYKLCCKDVQIKDIYIGSTCNFSRRKCLHKNFCNNEKNKAYNLKVYQFIRDNGGFGFWDMIQVEAYPDCTNKKELGQYERYHIEELKPALNCRIPTRTKKEYYCDNKEIILEQHKGYYEKNKDKILEKHKEYCDQNKDKIFEINKKYREQNKDKISEYYKEKYVQNKDKILEKIVCECGSEVAKSSLSRHKKTKKHLSIINC
jgi:hypothetical protein